MTKDEFLRQVRDTSAAIWAWGNDHTFVAGLILGAAIWALLFGVIL